MFVAVNTAEPVQVSANGAPQLDPCTMATATASADTEAPTDVPLNGAQDAGRAAEPDSSTQAATGSASESAIPNTSESTSTEDTTVDPTGELTAPNQNINSTNAGEPPANSTMPVRIQNVQISVLCAVLIGSRL